MEKAPCGCSYVVDNCGGCGGDHVINSSERPSERCDSHKHTDPDSLNDYIAAQLNERL